MRKYIPYFLFFLILLNLGSFVFQHKNFYLERYDPEYWSDRYQKSQWVKGYEAEEKMGDAELYAFAGWQMINGIDPTEINPDQPPLGKYLIGLSILIFKNPNIQALILGIGFLITFFLLSQEIIGSLNWALLTTLIFSLEPIFKENLATSMLDLPFAVFILATLFFLVKSKENWRWLIPTVASLVLVSTTKMYMVGFALTAMIGGYLLIQRRFKDLGIFISLAPLYILLYLGVYTVYFMDNHNFWDFKYYHFWVRHFARVKVENYPWGEVWRILLLGRWRVWWNSGGVKSVGQWNILWPVSFLSLFPGGLLVLVIFALSLLFIFSFSVPYPRYLLPLIPILYVSLGYSIKSFLKR